MSIGINMYQLSGDSYSFISVENSRFLEEEVILWAEDVVSSRGEFPRDITLILDTENMDNIDIYQAIDILADVGEYLEPI